jgi:hypothetical protein
VKLCTKLNQKHSHCLDTFYILKITNMATVRNFEVIYNKFNVVENGMLEETVHKRSHELV